MRNTNEPDIAETLGLDRSGRRRGAVRFMAWAALAAGMGAALYHFAGGGREAEVPRYVTARAAKGDVTVIVTATGTVEPTNQVEISSELSGIVRKVFVDYNDEVKAGQALIELDMVTLKAQVASSRASLAAAKARVVQAEATVREKDAQLKRTSTLAGRQFSSQDALDTAQAEYDRAVASLEAAQADVAVAEAQLAQNETSLAKAVVYSPIDGVVLKRSVEPGQTVAASFQTPILLTLAEDLRKMELRVDIDEADIGKVRPGQTATFTVEAYQDRVFPARIDQVRYASETVEGVVTYKAILTFDNAELLLRPGMTATAEILIQEVRGALVIPNAALRFRPPPAAEEKSGGGLSRLFFRIPKAPQLEEPEPKGSKRRVYVREGAGLKAVDVTIGATDGNKTEIVAGDLPEGAEVATDVAAQGAP